MGDGDTVNLHRNDAFAVEVRGCEHIPEAERNMTPRQMAFIIGGTARGHAAPAGIAGEASQRWT
jgi:hypothetical protein